MPSPAEAFFSTLVTHASIQGLIAAGEAEGPYLECKAPQAPQLDRGLKAQLAAVVSAFANSGGGVVILGVSTDSKLHAGLDVLTQIEPIGHCATFSKLLDRVVPTLNTPAVAFPPSRVIRAKTSDTKGVVVLYVPSTPGDPVQSLDDRRFYIRSGAECVEMPYETLKRMFAGSGAPDLVPLFDGRIVTQQPNGTWRVPIVLTNRATRAAEFTDCCVEIVNAEACEAVTAERPLQDASGVNPGHMMFTAEVARPIHRGLNQVLGALVVTMKKAKRAKRVLTLDVRVYCSGMRAKKCTMRVQLAKKGFSVKRVSESFVY